MSGLQRTWGTVGDLSAPNELQPLSSAVGKAKSTVELGKGFPQPLDAVALRRLLRGLGRDEVDVLSFLEQLLDRVCGDKETQHESIWPPKSAVKTCAEGSETRVIGPLPTAPDPFPLLFRRLSDRASLPLTSVTWEGGVRLGLLLGRLLATLSRFGGPSMDLTGRYDAVACLKAASFAVAWLAEAGQWAALRRAVAEAEERLGGAVLAAMEALEEGDGAAAAHVLQELPIALDPSEVLATVRREASRGAVLSGLLTALGLGLCVSTQHKAFLASLVPGAALLWRSGADSRSLGPLRRLEGLHKALQAPTDPNLSPNNLHADLLIWSSELMFYRSNETL